MLIILYQRVLSPMLPRSCRYYPSCSTYAKYCLVNYGPSSIIMITKRILSCNPISPGGYDPVHKKNMKQKHE